MSKDPPVGEAIAASPPLIRRMNLRLLLSLIRDRGPISRAELAKASGLSKPTVGVVVEALVDSGRVDERVASSGDRKRRPGPPEQLYSFRADRGFVIGFDVGADKLLAIVADLSGEVVASVRRKMPRAATTSAEALLETMRAVTDAVLERGALTPADVWAVSVGAPGVVDERSGAISLAPQLPAWEGLNLRQQLEPLFACPVLAANEVRLSLLAERWRGAAQGIDNALYMQIGVGIGAAVLIDGDVYQGAHGAAGEIGYLPLGEHDESATRRSGPGPFEHAAGGEAFARAGQAAARSASGEALRELADGDPDGVDAAIVFAAARAGDDSALAIVDELTQRLARGIAAAVVVLDPATVIIGGGVSRAGDALLEPLRKHVEGHLPIPIELVLSELGDEAVALGAVKLATRTADERLYEFESSGVAT